MARRKLPVGIRKRVTKSGAVRYQLRWVDLAGVRHAATYDTLHEAEAAQQDRFAELRHAIGGGSTTGATLYGDWYRRWFGTRPIRPSTADRDDSYARNHILPTWEDRPLASIREEDVWAWASSLPEGANLAPSTVTKIVAFFKRSLEAATGPRRALLFNPAAHVSAPPVPFSEARFLEPTEALRIERAMDPWWRLVIPFMLDTGLRIGEVASLRVAEVDTLAGTVRVSSTVSTARREKGERREQVGPPKTPAGYRLVPTLTPEVGARIDEQIDERSLGPDDYLFQGPKGGRMSPNNWRARKFNPAVEAAGLEDPQPTPHALRHTTVAHWLATGTDLYRVARWLGHNNIATLQRIYGHLLPADAAGAREMLSAIRRQAQKDLAAGRVADNVVNLSRLQS